MIGLLGRPGGYAIYPAIKEKNGQALLYSYQATSGSAFRLKLFKRSLIVTLDQNGVVSDVTYAASGMQLHERRVFLANFYSRCIQMS